MTCGARVELRIDVLGEEGSVSPVEEAALLYALNELPLRHFTLRPNHLLGRSATGDEAGEGAFQIVVRLQLIHLADICDQAEKSSEVRATGAVQKRHHLSLLQGSLWDHPHLVEDFDDLLGLEQPAVILVDLTEEPIEIQECGSEGLKGVLIDAPLAHDLPLQHAHRPALVLGDLHDAVAELHQVELATDETCHLPLRLRYGSQSLLALVILVSEHRRQNVPHSIEDVSEAEVPLPIMV
mmetsp:Transcript_90463/g.194015  ORF Transcript_90463/g.194015 Transcript_90463/m.194015 type:complete len:239 (+) Transcript_90463:828-1544(+)